MDELTAELLDDIRACARFILVKTPDATEAYAAERVLAWVGEAEPRYLGHVRATPASTTVAGVCVEAVDIDEDDNEYTWTEGG